MNAVELDGVSKKFDTSVAVDNVSLAIAHGEFVTLLGPSGCGKTTTLRMIAGLVMPTGGQIRIDGTDVTDVPVHQRNIGMVFQSHALFPHLTVLENVGFALRMRGIGRAEREQRAREALDLVQLTKMESRYPRQLSGGQQQRVALARALVFDPKVLLLDEPFGALDRKLRELLQVELREVTRRIGITAIFVTHDQEEALILSDRIAVMNAGRLEQLDGPARLFDDPTSRFVADFMGFGNLLPGRIRATNHGQAVVALGRHDISVPSSAGLGEGDEVTVALRADRIRIARTALPDALSLPGRVAEIRYHGTQHTYKVWVEGLGEHVLARVSLLDNPESCQTGEAVHLCWDPSAVRLLQQ